MERVEGKRRLAAEYRFRVGHLKPDVRIHVWENLDENAGYRYEFTQSHFIHAPNLMDPYMTSGTIGESVEELFHDCVRGFEMFYRDDAWLVPNEHF
jgi:hypothetical protein